MRRAASVDRLVVAALCACLGSSVASGPRASGEDAPEESPEAEKPTVPPVTLAEWETRDVEGRWVLYVTSRATAQDWASFLASNPDPDQGEQLVEWIAITRRFSDWVKALAGGNDAGWMRCAVWHVHASDSHGRDNARAILTARAPEFLAWLAKFPKAETGPVADLAKTLRAKPSKDVQPVDVSHLLPPLEPEVVLRDLVPPDALEEFGTARRAKHGVVYVHQVERAIQALLTSDLRVEPWLSRLSALLRHPHPAVRRAASVAYAEVAPDLVPVDALLALADDPREPTDVRVEALFGASRSSHPKAYVRLCEAALVSGHFAQTAAVSRLQDYADEFTLGVLREVASRAGETPDVKKLASDGVTSVGSRIENREGTQGPDEMERLLASAAWADLTGGPMRERMVPFVRALLAERAADASVRAMLERTAGPAAPERPGALATAAGRRRAIARAALDAAKR